MGSYQNNWISVLIDQDGPPGDLATYVNQIVTLAPALEQIHLRVFGSQAADYTTYANLILLCWGMNKAGCSKSVYSPLGYMELIATMSLSLNLSR